MGRRLLNETCMVRPEGEPFWLPTELLAKEMSSKIGWIRDALFRKKPFNPKRLEGSLVEGRMTPVVSLVASHPTSVVVKQFLEGSQSLEAIRRENERRRAVCGLPPMSTNFFFDTYVGRV